MVMGKHTPQQYGYITISVIAILLNMIVIFLFLTRKYLRKMYSNFFLFSLAISDFCYAIVAIPLLVKCEQTTEHPSKLCYAYAYVMVFFGYSTIYHILLAIAEKLCAICFTLKHHSMFSRSIAIKLSLSVWLLSLMFTHIPVWWDFIFASNSNSSSNTSTKKLEEAYHKFNFATAFALPVLISAIMYSIILHKIFKAANARLTEDNRNRARLHAEKKAAFTFAIMLAAFLFAWSTWFIARVYDGILTSMTLYHFITFCKLLDPVFNPILYTFLKNDFRQAFLSLLRNKKRKNEMVRMALIRMNNHGTGMFTHEAITMQNSTQHSIQHKDKKNQSNSH